MGSPRSTTGGTEFTERSARSARSARPASDPWPRYTLICTRFVNMTGALSIVPTGAPRILRRFQIGVVATVPRYAQSGWIWICSGAAQPPFTPELSHVP